MEPLQAQPSRTVRSLKRCKKCRVPETAIHDCNKPIPSLEQVAREWYAGASFDNTQCEIDFMIGCSCNYSLRIETLKPGQIEAIRALLECKDTLLVCPTNFGKSAVYQIPLLLFKERGAVIILPTNILMTHVKSQMDKIGISCCSLHATKQLQDIDPFPFESKVSSVTCIVFSPL